MLFDPVFLMCQAEILLFLEAEVVLGISPEVKVKESQS